MNSSGHDLDDKSNIVDTKIYFSYQQMKSIKI